MKILSIEDDLKLRKYISEYLVAYDFEVFLINDFENILDEVDRVAPDLILLDINLPKFDSFYYLKMIRKTLSIPIIIVSARSDEAEQVRGMELGADDYITKPFSMGILVAKINAISRRLKEYRQDTSNEKEFAITEKDIITLDESMKLRYKNEIVELSKNEFRILKLMLENVNKVVTREELLEALWDDMSFVDDNTLTVNMTRLKKRLEGIGVKDVITTKRGVGYVLGEKYI